MIKNEKKSTYQTKTPTVRHNQHTAPTSKPWLMTSLVIWRMRIVLKLTRLTRRGKKKHRRSLQWSEIRTVRRKLGNLRQRQAVNSSDKAVWLRFWKLIYFGFYRVATDSTAVTAGLLDEALTESFSAKFKTCFLLKKQTNKLKNIGYKLERDVFFFRTSIQ